MKPTTKKPTPKKEDTPDFHTVHIVGNTFQYGPQPNKFTQGAVEALAKAIVSNAEALKHNAEAIAASARALNGYCPPMASPMLSFNSSKKD